MMRRTARTQHPRTETMRSHPSQPVKMRLNRNNNRKLNNKLQRMANNLNDTTARVPKDSSSITSFKQRSRDWSETARRTPL
jgi:hypothetical protein